MIEDFGVSVQFIENKTGEITAGAYSASIVDVVNNVQQFRTGVLLVINNNILGLIWGNYSIYLFDSHSTDENVSSCGRAVLLKFDTLHYLRSVYYNVYPLILYFQMKFIKVHCTVNSRSAIKYLLKMERLLEKQKRNLKAKAIKYHDDPQRKKQAIKKRYEDEKESIKQNKTKS